MGYYVSHMFGIRTGGVFSDAVDMDDLRTRVAKVADECAKDKGWYPQPTYGAALSPELVAGKGSYVVIAGVFNYFALEEAQKFECALSKEFGVEVMHMGWDEERDAVCCQIYLAGEPLMEVPENPIGRILRRVI